MSADDDVAYNRAQHRIKTDGNELMNWGRMLAYITGTVDQELLLRNEFLVAENRILRDQVKGRLLLTDAERATLGEMGHRLGRKALEDVANFPQRCTLRIR